MYPKKLDQSQGQLFEKRLSEQLNKSEPLFMLAYFIDWDSIDEKLKGFFSAEKGASAKPTRLIAGLLMLQSMYDVSDEGLATWWVQNPYWQYFCGYDYLQWEFPIHPTSLVKWRQRLGEEGMQIILKETIDTALRTRAVKESSFARVIVDTTVMPKNITPPTDAKTLYRAIETLVRGARKYHIPLRQSYIHVGKRAMTRASRYVHARQMRRARKQINWLRIRVGRLIRDIERKALPKDLEALRPLLDICTRAMEQRKDSKNKVYSIHEPEVACIAKGKAHKRFEFGRKVSLLITHKEGLALSAMALEGNPCDAHTLEDALKQSEALSNSLILESYADRGYQGHKLKDRIVRLSSHRPKEEKIRKRIKRRQAIEPHIGHMKSEGRLSRNYLRGVIGDKIHAVLCGVGHNLRLILRRGKLAIA